MLHERVNGHYGKEETYFAIRKDFLEKLKSINNVPDSEFRIKSDTIGFESTENPNIAWRENTFENVSSLGKNFIRFSDFKMALYKEKDKVIGSDGNEQPVELIIKIFLRLLKIDALQAIKATLGLKEGFDICWGVTIPALWQEKEQRKMNEIAKSVYGNVTLLQEPQCALAYYLKYGKSNNSDSRVISVIVDAGGGTTDLACIVDTDDGKKDSVFMPEGTYKGGNDVDNEFWICLCSLLKSKSGSKKYDNTSDLVKELITNFFNDDPEGRREFFQSLRDVQCNYKSNRYDKIYFAVKKSYKDWLTSKGHNEILKYIQNIDGEIKIESNIVRSCYDKIISDGNDSIVATVDSFLTKVKERFGGKINRIILSGGLSYAPPLEAAVKKLALEKYKSEFFSCGEIERLDGYSAMVRCSGAVAMGAAYMLSQGKDYITNAARRNIFYKIKTPKRELVDIRLKDLRKLHYGEVLYPGKSNVAQYALLKDKLLSYNSMHNTYNSSLIEIIDGQEYVSSLAPICVQGCQAHPFIKEHIGVYANVLKMSIYVLDNPFILYCGLNNNIHLLKRIEKTLNYYLGEVTLMVETNKAQSGNKIEISIIDEFSGECVWSDEID